MSRLVVAATEAPPLSLRRGALSRPVQCRDHSMAHPEAINAPNTTGARPATSVPHRAVVRGRQRLSKVTVTVSRH